MNDLKGLKQELEILEEELFEKEFSNKEELIKYEEDNKPQFDRYYTVLKEIESLEWKLLSPKEKEEQKEQEKMSKLKREGKLFEYLNNNKNS